MNRFCVSKSEMLNKGDCQCQGSSVSNDYVMGSVRFDLFDSQVHI